MTQQWTITLPQWANDFPTDQILPSDEDRMRLAIELARSNVDQNTGGPFGAAVFEEQTGQLISIGVNRVVPANCSIAHAEMLALAFAQQKLGHYDLGAQTLLACQLVTSCEPCAMCLGAIPWSGVRSLVCGAREADVRAIGFDEGHKPPQWTQACESRGIHVTRDVLRQEACQVLQQYAQRTGIIYNARQGTPE